MTGFGFNAIDAAFARYQQDQSRNKSDKQLAAIENAIKFGEQLEMHNRTLTLNSADRLFFISGIGGYGTGPAQNQKPAGQNNDGGKNLGNMDAGSSKKTEEKEKKESESAQTQSDSQSGKEQMESKDQAGDPFQELIETYLKTEKEKKAKEAEEKKKAEAAAKKEKEALTQLQKDLADPNLTPEKIETLKTKYGESIKSEALKTEMDKLISKKQAELEENKPVATTQSQGTTATSTPDNNGTSAATDNGDSPPPGGSFNGVG